MGRLSRINCHSMIEELTFGDFETSHAKERRFCWRRLALHAVQNGESAIKNNFHRLKLM